MINPHAPLPLSPRALWQSLVDNRQLIARLTRRDMAARYRGSFGGMLWTVVTPVVMLLVYTFVFSVVFKARWGIDEEQGRAQFAIVLFAGLLMHALFAEVLNGCTAIIAANTNYVKKVVFPLEVLPVIQLGMALVQCLIGIAVLLVAGLVFNGTVLWTAPLILLVLLPLSLIVLGFGWFLAALGVYVRDVAQVTQVLTTILLFVSPVFFPVSAIPEAFQTPMRLNPLTFLIEQAREVLVWGRLPDVGGLLAYTLGALLVAWLGYAWFQTMRKGFADVL
ncbi:MAG: ABC transporter permease [Cardiobacteriaceae bacterium]|nr:ABC transporter permease [Cardiobacteriaceae bacterium]